MSELLNQLNPKQQEAVLQTEGAVLILAGAGSGKTRTLTHRVAYLIKEKQINPQNILAVTFTNKAAEEMADRIKKLLGLPREANIYSASLPTMGTFHSVCVRVLRREIEQIGYENNFVIYDDQDQKVLLKQIMKDLNISDKDIKPAVVLGVISSAKNQLQNAEEYSNSVDSYREELIAKCFYRYEQELRKADALDFDDLLMKTVEVFEQFPETLKKYQQLWRYVMVDEYQDTNKAQYQLLKMLAREHQNICVVGDDYQSVYRWRGADISNILNFEKDYAGTKIILLEQNYRSTQIILDVADCVISNNKNQKRKKLWTENVGGEPVALYRAYDEKDEARFVVEEIADLQDKMKLQLTEVAVLYRTNAQSRALEEAFMKAGVPYKIIGGLKFYQRKEIKDILAYLYFVNNPKDKVSFNRIINEPKRGLGGKTVEKVLELIDNYQGDILETLRNLEAEKAKGNLQLPVGKIKDLKNFAEMISGIKKFALGSTPKKIIQKIYEDTGYKLMLEKMGDEGEVRQENILELLTVAEEYDKLQATIDNKKTGVDKSTGEILFADGALIGEQTLLQKFLEDVALVSQTDRDLNMQEAVPLMTMHSAKGLEYKVIFVVGAEEGLFPHSRASLDAQEMEEERRLCYVAITRAKEKLYFVYTNIRNIYGSTQTSIRSRFIDEIDEKFLREQSSEMIGEIDVEREGGVFGRETSFENNSFKKGEFAGDDFNDTFSDSWEEIIDLDAEDEEDMLIKNNFKTGEKVKHDTFGKGIVVATDEETLTVAFENIGLKKLAKKIVQLEADG
jgi:DNA helicase-2/ATP-dependent DNA helicase PcrA